MTLTRDTRNRHLWCYVLESPDNSRWSTEPTTSIVQAAIDRDALLERLDGDLDPKARRHLNVSLHVVMPMPV